MHKNHNALIITLLTIIVILLCYLAFYKLRVSDPAEKTEQNKKTTVSKSKERSVNPPQPASFVIPASVRARYNALANQYANSLGSMISYCEKGTEKLFVASGSSGYTGVEYYYDTVGKPLGSDTFGDVGDEYFIEKRFNLSSYNCRVLLISK